MKKTKMRGCDCMYLDPGFGGMLLQIIIAIAAVGGGLLYSFRKKIRRLFTKDLTDTYANRETRKQHDLEDDVIDTLS